MLLAELLKGLPGSKYFQTKDAASFKEEEHPRDDDGKFGEGAGHSKESKTPSKQSSKQDYSSPEGKKAIDTIFKDVPGGTKVEVSQPKPGTHSIKAKGKGLNFTGTIDEKTSDFFVDEVHISRTEQGKGIGKNIIKNMVSFAQQKGLSSISLWAAEKAGIYAWAKLGFDYKSPAFLEGVKDSLNVFCEENKIKISSDQLNKIKSARDVAELSVPGKIIKDMELGKAFMLSGGHGSWVGRLKL